MLARLVILSLTVLVLTVVVRGSCPGAKPDPTFEYDQFEGRWFEIGAYRNAGPYLWNRDCKCSMSKVLKNPGSSSQGDSEYSYICNQVDPRGPLQILDTRIFDMSPPGQFKQWVLPNPAIEAHELTVVEMTKAHALVHRCGDYDGELSYTTQILSREPTLDESVIKKLQAKVEELNLNPEKAEYQIIAHEDCEYI